MGLVVVFKCQKQVSYLRFVYFPDSSDEGEMAGLRPIDMLAKSPGRPLVQAHSLVHVHPQSTAASDVDTATTTRLLTLVEEKLTVVAQVSALCCAFHAGTCKYIYGDCRTG